MQSVLELDTRSPIVCRVLRVRKRMQPGGAPMSSLLSSEDIVVSEQGYDDVSDLAHLCAGRASIHVWEKLSIHPQEPFALARPVLDLVAALPDPAEAEQ
jgi:hypothetical protein